MGGWYPGGCGSSWGWVVGGPEERRRQPAAALARPPAGCRHHIAAKVVSRVERRARRAAARRAWGHTPISGRTRSMPPSLAMLSPHTRASPAGQAAAVGRQDHWNRHPRSHPGRPSRALAWHKQHGAARRVLSSWPSPCQPHHPPPPPLHARPHTHLPTRARRRRGSLWLSTCPHRWDPAGRSTRLQDSARRASRRVGVHKGGREAAQCNEHVLRSWSAKLWKRQKAGRQAGRRAGRRAGGHGVPRLGARPASCQPPPQTACGAAPAHRAARAGRSRQQALEKQGFGQLPAGAALSGGVPAVGVTGGRAEGETEQLHTSAPRLPQHTNLCILLA